MANMIEYDYSREVTTRFDNMNIMGDLIRANSVVELKEHKVYYNGLNREWEIGDIP